jgi:hypothetical protein
MSLHRMSTDGHVLNGVQRVSARRQVVTGRFDRAVEALPDSQEGRLEQI